MRKSCEIWKSHYFHIFFILFSHFGARESQTWQPEEIPWEAAAPTSLSDPAKATELDAASQGEGGQGYTKI